MAFPQHNSLKEVLDGVDSKWLETVSSLKILSRNFLGNCKNNSIKQERDIQFLFSNPCGQFFFDLCQWDSLLKFVVKATALNVPSSIYAH